MLTESKLIYGPYNFKIENADDDAWLYEVDGLKKDSVSINETVETEELEDGVARELMRKLEIVATFSELDEGDIANIQGYGDGQDHDLFIQFETADHEIKVADSASGDNVKYIAEVEDGKMKITAQKTSSSVDSANFTTSSVTTH